MTSPPALRIHFLLDEESSAFACLLTECLQEILCGEMAEFPGAAAGERLRTRAGRRAGHRRVHIASRVGELELHMPRDRSRRLTTDLFARYPRAEYMFIAALADMHVRGASAARVAAMAENLCGHSFSPRAIGQIRRGVVGALERFGRAAMSDAWPRGVVHAERRRARVGNVVRSCKVRGIVGVNRKRRTEISPVTGASAEPCPLASPMNVFDRTPAARIVGRAAALLIRPVVVLGGVVGVVLVSLFLGSIEAPDISADDVVRASPVYTPTAPIVPVPGPRPILRATVGAPTVTPQPVHPRYQLTGVMASANGNGSGVALIAIAGDLARAFRVGSVVDGDLLLTAVSQGGASLGPANGPVTLMLEVDDSARAAKDVRQASAGQSAPMPAAQPQPLAESDPALPETAIGGRTLMTSAPAEQTLQSAAENRLGPSTSALVPDALANGQPRLGKGPSPGRRMRLRR
jgi:hypothetical protein